MRLRVIAVGRLSGPAMQGLCNDFEKRVGHYFTLEVIEIPDSTRRKSKRNPRDAEGDAILSRLGESDRLVALSRSGREVGSRELADLLNSWSIEDRTTTFVIGGADGLSEAIIQKSQTVLSMSKMTFTHEMARLLLLEQLYRAGTIQRGEPYHRGA